MVGADPNSVFGLLAVAGFALMAWGGGKLERMAFNMVVHRFHWPELTDSRIFRNLVTLFAFVLRVFFIFAFWLYTRGEVYANAHPEMYWYATHFAVFALMAEVAINYAYSSFDYRGKGWVITRETAVVFLSAAISAFYFVALSMSTKVHPVTPFLDPKTNLTVSNIRDGTHRTAFFYKSMLGIYGGIWAVAAIIRVVYMIWASDNKKFWDALEDMHYDYKSDRVGAEAEEETGLTGAYD